MSRKEEARIFVGGLSWDVTERKLGSVFSRFGKVLDVLDGLLGCFGILVWITLLGYLSSDKGKLSGFSTEHSNRVAAMEIMVERDTGRPRGFGFVTFSDKRAVEEAITEMHNKELGGRQISVNKAEPKVASDDTGYGYGGRGGSRGGADDSLPVARSECFKCGRSGHWARECTSGGGGRFSSRSRIAGYGDGETRGDRYSERYADDRHDGGRYDGGRSDGSRYGDGKGRRYNGGRDGYSGDRYSGDRYGSGAEKYPSDVYKRERSFDGDRGPRVGGGGDKHINGGPTRHNSNRERLGPYDRPSNGGRRSSFDDRY